MATNTSPESLSKTGTPLEKCGTLLKNGEKEVSQALDKAKDFFSEKTENIVPAIEDAVDGAKAGVTAALKEAGSTIKKYPVQSLLIGFGVGCLVGMLLRPSK